MSSRATLKTYFNTGDIPTESQYADLIDSLGVNASELTSGTLNDARLSTNVLRATAQTLTDEQKAQTRTNIGTVERNIDVTGDPLEPNRKFSFLLATDDRLDNGGYQNITESWGYNLDRSNATEPSTYFTIESKYWFNNTGPWVTEAHLQGVTIEGTFWRSIYCVMPRAIADVAVSQIELRTQKFRLADFLGNEKIRYDFNTNTIVYQAALSHLVPNNFAPVSQFNAAGNTYISLPYINASDQLQLTGPIRHQAGHSTGSGQNSAYYVQGIGTFPNNSYLLELLGPSTANSNFAMISCTGAATSELTTVLYNQNTTANNKAIYQAATLSTTGKALTRYQCAATDTGFEVGFDAATDSFIVSSIYGSGNSANWFMWINRTTAAATFTGSMKVHGNVGFNNVAPIAKPTVSGSRGGNAALSSLLTALANYGLITDSTS